VSTPSLNERPHVLYRFFDAEDRLLYVGITVGIAARLAKHEVEKSWYSQIARIAVEHFPTRGAVLAAERAAIQAEKPLYNIQHNGLKPVLRPSSDRRDVPAGCRRWTFRSRGSDHEKTVPLWLYWEVDCDPISDDYYIDEIEPEDLWREWVRRYPSNPDALIGWYIDGPGICESAPLQDLRWRSVDQRKHGWTTQQIVEDARNTFLKYYTHPYDAETGDPIQWSALPVIDKVWREGNLPRGPFTSKGGFIQEATGWKPSPLQPFVNVEQLAHASGLARPSLFLGREKGAA
jgi:predicted GIY-YIG superfamily endonuclease